MFGTSSSHNCLNTCKGPLTALPYSCSNSENLSELWGASLYANKRGATYPGHSLGCSAAKCFSIFFSVLLNLSQKPLHIGCQGMLLSPYTDSSLKVLSIMADVNWVPQSLSTSLGIPTQQNIPSSASATVVASIFFNASG